MPGAASQTNGIALTTRIVVASIPSCEKVSARPELQLAGEAGLAVDDDDPVGAVAFRGRPLGREVGRHAIDVLDHDRVAPVDDADRLEAHGPDGAGVDGSRGDVERVDR